MDLSKLPPIDPNNLAAWDAVFPPAWMGFTRLGKSDGALCAHDEVREIYLLLKRQVVGVLCWAELPDSHQAGSVLW